MYSPKSAANHFPRPRPRNQKSPIRNQKSPRPPNQKSPIRNRQSRELTLDQLAALSKRSPGSLTPRQLRSLLSLKRLQDSGALTSDADYAAHKARSAAHAKRISAAGREIGPLPPPADPARRAAALDSLQLFAETYFAEQFSLPWSSEHPQVLKSFEYCARTGGLFSLAMPRGSGKTSIAEVAALWAVFRGDRKYVAIIAATNDKAVDILETILRQLESNTLLLADFPEVCFPIHALDGIHQSSPGQILDGTRTEMQFKKRKLILPTVAGSVASGAIFQTAGLKSASILGLKHARIVEGGTIAIDRPDLVIIDDPQTPESAWSLAQTAARESILSGAVLGLAGPGKKLAAFALVTVIAPGDLADRLLDRRRYPDWQGERYKMLYALPADEKAWDEYWKIRSDRLASGIRIPLENDFYAAHREAMDAGAIVAWPERHEPGELSGLQCAMNIRFRNPEAFASEYQNEPLIPKAERAQLLTPQQVAERTNGRPRGQVPISTTKLTAFIDVGDHVLFWCAVAWQDDFTGFIVDYGTFPEQNRSFFTSDNAPRTLGRVFRGAGVDGAILAGLSQLVAQLLARDWPRSGSGVVRIDRLLVDMGHKPGIVAAVKHKAGGSAMMLARGVGLKAGSKPISMYQRRPGWILGANWYIPNVRGTNEFPHVCNDVNWWKTFVHEHLAVAPGDPGAITIYGTAATEHRLFSEHVAASESYVTTFGQGRYVQEWKARPNRPDNHWFDCLVGCAAGASQLGIRAQGAQAETAPKRKRLRVADLLAQRPPKQEGARP